MIPLITSAQKFDLGSEFAAVAEELANDFTGLVRAFEHCRLPFAQTWVEVAQADRPQFMNAHMHAPDFQRRPKRIGWLLSATRPDLSAWKAHLFWSMDTGCSCAALAMEFDMTNALGNVAELPDLTDRQLRVIDPNKMSNHPGWDKASEPIKLSMLNHTNPTVPDYGMPEPHGIQLHQVNDFYQVVVELARSDWAGEASYILAVIGLLNARNAVSVETVDNTEYNRKRVKRGRLPLFSHKVLKIAHRQQKRVYGDGAPRGEYEKMRAHYVRGHFKKRQSGIFFWTPHIRGDLSQGRIDKDYEIT
jgi:hypothetical protein